MENLTQSNLLLPSLCWSFPVGKGTSISVLVSQINFFFAFEIGNFAIRCNAHGLRQCILIYGTTFGPVAFAPYHFPHCISV